MHILLASLSAATSPTGVCRHAANVVQGLLSFSTVRKISMFTGVWQEDYFRNAFHLNDDRLEIVPVSITNTTLRRNLWHLLGLPAAARMRDVDLVHLAYPVPFLQLSCPSVVSLHDLYPFDMARNFGRRAWLNRAALKLCLRNVDAIACVSEQTQIRAHQLHPKIAGHKTEVVPNSVFLHRAPRQTSLPDELQDQAFVLCVAQHRANKNLALLIRCFALARDRKLIAEDAKLVIVGIEGPETQSLKRLVSLSEIDRHVLLLRGIPDAQLISLYASCEVFVAPSLLEGFGLPVAEALCAGSRVICSDIPAFRALGDGRCVFFDPLDTSGESLLQAMREALDTPMNAESGGANLFPQQTAAKYIDIYASLLQSERVTHASMRKVGTPTVTAGTDVGGRLSR